LLLPLDAGYTGSPGERFASFLSGLLRTSPNALFFSGLARRLLNKSTSLLCARSRLFTPVRAQVWGRADVVHTRASPAHLGVSLRIVLVEALIHSSPSRIVGESASTHKHTMARKIEGAALPRDRVLVYSCICASSIAYASPSVLARRSRSIPPSARPCVASPPKYARPHTLVQTPRA
ncbi:hypothetical protein B0H13DRAFT_2071335, partial [Mycena leptocephala]